MSTAALQALAQSASAPRLTNDAAERQAAALVAQMTVDEKAARKVNGAPATFNESLLQDVASAISAEVRAIHATARAEGRRSQIGKGNGLAVWSPNINIFRDPR